MANRDAEERELLDRASQGEFEALADLDRAARLLVCASGDAPDGLDA